MNHQHIAGGRVYDNTWHLRLRKMLTTLLVPGSNVSTIASSGKAQAGKYFNFAQHDVIQLTDDSRIAFINELDIYAYPCQPLHVLCFCTAVTGSS